MLTPGDTIRCRKNNAFMLHAVKTVYGDITKNRRANTSVILNNKMIGIVIASELVLRMTCDYVVYGVWCVFDGEVFYTYESYLERI